MYEAMLDFLTFLRLNAVHVVIWPVGLQPR
jgi:hypothetical protein